MTSSGSAAPGWYPHSGGGLVWWNGQNWDFSVPAGPVVPAAAPVYAAPVQYAAPTAPTTVPPAVLPVAPPVAPKAAAAANMFRGTMPPPVAPPEPVYGAGGLAPKGRGGNVYALICLGVSAVYLVIALKSHYVVFGVFPAIMTLRSFQARERLAPVALIAAVIAIGVAISRVSGH